MSERVVRALLGGIVAGGVFLAVTMWFASSLGDPAEGPLMMISTTVLGKDALLYVVNFLVIAPLAFPMF